MDALQVILPKGDPNGIKIIELSGWNGRCFVLPRTEIRSLKDRPEVDSSGLYFLFGEDKETNEQLVYIGESSGCLGRLASHDSKKDFWNEAVVFLDPPDRNYLESISTKLAKECNRFIVENSVQPQEESQTEFNHIKNQKYFEGVKKILSTFGYEVFEKIAESYLDDKVYYLKSDDGANAKAKVLDHGQILVFKNSIARIRETEAFEGWSYGARRKYLEDGTLVPVGDSVSYVFTKDVLFKTPSAAAATIKGAPINGWTAWKDEKGVTLDENLRK